MSRPHIAMRKIRTVLRLRAEGLSLRQVSASVQVPFTTVADHVRRADRAGLSWPLPEGLDDDALGARLFVAGDASGPATPFRPWPTKPAPAVSETSADARSRRACVGWASQSAR